MEGNVVKLPTTYRYPRGSMFSSQIGMQKTWQMKCTTEVSPLWSSRWVPAPLGDWGWGVQVVCQWIQVPIFIFSGFWELQVRRAKRHMGVGRRQTVGKSTQLWEILILILVEICFFEDFVLDLFPWELPVCWWRSAETQSFKVHKAVPGQREDGTCVAPEPGEHQIQSGAHHRYRRD